MIRIAAARAIAGIALVQGLLLFGLHQSREHHTWPATDLRWLVAFYTLAAVIPLTLELCAAHLADPRLWRALGVLAVPFGAMGAYVGWVLSPAPRASAPDLVLVFALCMAALWWILLPFLQAGLRSGRLRPWQPYGELFELAWQNILVVGESALFTGLFWLLLWLWAALFDLIGVSFFEKLFTKPAFAYPVTSVAFGYAVSLVQSRESFVVMLRRHLLGVLAWLLPLVALIETGFLLALPATGLAPLWKTGQATFLMLWLQVFLVVFLNAAWQDGTQPPPYPAWLRRVVSVAVLGLPVYAGLCAYSLGLRIGQHGLSVDRIWAAVLTLVLGLYGLGYAVAATRTGPWMGELGRVNLAMAWVVAGLLVAVNTPLLDPRRLAASSQLARLLAGQVVTARFDYDYLRFSLGAYGDRALRRLASVQGHADSTEIRRLAVLALAKTQRWGPPSLPDQPSELARHIEMLPAGAALEPGFLAYLQRTLRDSMGFAPGCFQRTGLPCVMLAVDLDGDGLDEVASITGWPKVVYARTDSGWRRVGELVGRGYAELEERWIDSLRRQPPRAVPPRWRALEIGGQWLYVAEDPR
ncbi:MAG TPA: DUF4153 domain-containing protein [Gemmatimonadales bacterium]|nr:DUF4153 domain-containing protein [Gemmatimonadales bacterium]